MRTCSNWHNMVRRRCAFHENATSMLMVFSMSICNVKAVPNKNAGFIVLLTSIFTLFFLGEKRNLSSFTRLIDSNNGFSISFFFLLNLSLLWIGAQFPQFKFLSHARILTLDFYGVLVFILLA